MARQYPLLFACLFLVLSEGFSVLCFTKICENRKPNVTAKTKKSILEPYLTSNRKSTIWILLSNLVPFLAFYRGHISSSTWVFHLKMLKMKRYWKLFILLCAVAVAARCLQRKNRPRLSVWPWVKTNETVHASGLNVSPRSAKIGRHM